MSEQSRGRGVVSYISPQLQDSQFSDDEEEEKEEEEEEEDSVEVRGPTSVPVMAQFHRFLISLLSYKIFQLQLINWAGQYCLN